MISNSVMLQEMANSLLETHNLVRKGLGLDETCKMYTAIFNGEEGFEYVDRCVQQKRKSSFTVGVKSCSMPLLFSI